MSPVSGSTLICNLLDCANFHYPRRTYTYDFGDPTCPRNRAAQLFGQFEIVYLTIQQRADMCPWQTAMIKALQDGVFKMTADVIRAFEQHQLTREDIVKDPSWVTDSIVLVRPQTPQKHPTHTAHLNFAHDPGMFMRCFVGTALTCHVMLCAFTQTRR